MEAYRRDGYMVLEDFYTENEVEQMKEAGIELTHDIPEDEGSRANFHKLIENANYLMGSSDKIRYFFEKEAIDENGKLLVDPKVSLNKIGHALHWFNPIFRKYTFCNKIKKLCDEILDLQDPRVVQSMYMYKNAKIGDEVIPHQDSTYLYTQPENRLFGFWISLEDATTENGCLWFAPGSHNSGVHRRFIRNPDTSSKERLMYTSPQPFYPASSFRAVPVKKGSLIVLDGLVVHKSDPNRSDKPRPAYTFHVVDFDKTTYAEDNWLQPTEVLPFMGIYENR